LPEKLQKRTFLQWRVKEKIIREKSKSVLDVLELFYTIGQDETRKFFRKLYEYPELMIKNEYYSHRGGKICAIRNIDMYNYVMKAINEMLDTIEKGRLYCNDHLKKVASNYKMKVPYLMHEYSSDKLHQMMVKNMSVSDIESYEQEHWLLKRAGKEYGYEADLKVYVIIKRH